MTHDHTLVVTKRNDILRCVEGKGFHKSEFVWKTESAQVALGSTIAISVLWHRASGFYCKFHTDGSMWELKYSPGVHHRVERPPYVLESWDLVQIWCDEWAALLRSEVDAPDLWAELSDHPELQSSIDPGNNSSFSRKEQQLLREGLQKLQAAIESQASLNEAKLEAVRIEIAHLSEATGRVGRFDFTRMLFGAVASLVMRRVFDSPFAAALLAQAKEQFDWLWDASTRFLSE